MRSVTFLTGNLAPVYFCLPFFFKVLYSFCFRTDYNAVAFQISK
jgi:hypothetical protein